MTVGRQRATLAVHWVAMRFGAAARRITVTLVMTPAVLPREVTIELDEQFA
jgi:hypothetical protein